MMASLVKKVSCTEFNRLRKKTTNVFKAIVRGEGYDAIVEPGAITMMPPTLYCDWTKEEVKKQWSRPSNIDGYLWAVTKRVLENTGTENAKNAIDAMSNAHYDAKSVKSIVVDALK